MFNSLARIKQNKTHPTKIHPTNLYPSVFGRDVWGLVCQYLNSYDKDVLHFSYTNQFLLIKSSKKVSIAFTTYCASNGYTRLLRFAKSHDLVINKKAYHGAIAGNFTDTIIYLESLGCMLSVSALCVAAQYGHINILKRNNWNRNTRYPQYHKATMYAARGGQFETLKYLYVVGCRFSSNEVHEAILNNHFHLVKHYIENIMFIKKYNDRYCYKDGGYHYTLRLMVRNALSTDLRLVKYICEQLSEAKILVGEQKRYGDYDVHLSYYAIKSNNVEVYDYLVNSGYIRIRPNDLIRAINHGGIEIYEYLLNCGLAIRDNFFYVAVRHNRLLFMQYFHQHKEYSCKLPTDHLRVFVNRETSNWLTKNGYTF